MPAWTTEIEIAYDFGHLYVLDAAGHWSDTEGRIDLRMPHVGEFGVPVTLEGYGAKPALDLAGWDHVTEFSLRVQSEAIAFASGSVGAVRVGLANGAYRARWSARDGAYRFQLWPGPPAAPRAELKRRPEPASDLGDIPALLHDEGVQSIGTIVGTRVRGDALQLYVRLSAWRNRSWNRTLRCDGAVRWQATSEPFSRAVLHAEHPGLLPYADERGGLSFNGVPAEPDRLVAALRAAHDETAGPHVAFEEGDLAERLAVGYGRLASGPVTLLREYAQVADVHGVATNLIVTGPGRSGLTLLELSDTFVVAERFSVVES
ncbi:hypothetical protein DVA67_023245 [Solirubrobacter sp. CPCC 204708]|uniref:Uncharacterized protein n=1 Tax=Solirubrobacter deserti TaxID=2282478 RepID=A0ABT4RVB3_9ACTN|nr:hypothetical protein [Solirubrobacter deserti]MBE2318908.1 hypothetical protein [Solirubrobacter deserti]MDA0142412.1 hypothetical protein [Solirubrobacter deserti]